MAAVTVNTSAEPANPHCVEIVTVSFSFYMKCMTWVLLKHIMFWWFLNSKNAT